jgi:hypothetical protein
MRRIIAPLIFCTVIAFVGIFLSEYFHLYDLWSEYDTFLHFLGGIGITWLAFAVFAGDLKHLSSWKQVVLFISVTAFIGLLWEFAEFLAGSTRHTAPWLWHWFRGGGLKDTLLDLAADIAGAAVFTFCVLTRRR